MELFLAKSNPPQSIFEHTQDLLKALENLILSYGGHFTTEEIAVIRVAVQYLSLIHI